MQDLGDFRSDDGKSLADAPSGSTSILRVLLCLRRRWVLFAIVWAIPVALAAAYSLTIRPSYRPQATLEIRPEMSLVSADASDAAYAASLPM